MNPISYSQFPRSKIDTEFDEKLSSTSISTQDGKPNSFSETCLTAFFFLSIGELHFSTDGNPVKVKGNIQIYSM